MEHLEGSGTPVLYIGRKVLKRLMLLISGNCNNGTCVYCDVGTGFF
jgi:hypothetical protein